MVQRHQTSVLLFDWKRQKNQAIDAGQTTNVFTTEQSCTKALTD